MHDTSLGQNLGFQKRNMTLLLLWWWWKHIL